MPRNRLNPLATYGNLLAANRAATVPGTGVVGMARNAAARRNRLSGWERAQYELQGTGAANVPVISDVAGLGGDVIGFAREPETITPMNVGLSALGLLPFVPPLGIVAGRRAKTVSKEAVEMAEQMERAGATREEIWNATGEAFGQSWFKGPEGEWRFEIPDEGARLNEELIAERAAGYAEQAAKQRDMFNDAAVLRREMDAGRMTPENMLDQFTERFGHPPAEGALSIARGSPLEDIRARVDEWTQKIVAAPGAGTVERFVEHPELMRAYPELGEYSMVARVGPTKGSFRNIGFGEVEMQGVGPARMDTTLHELQHGVQQLEGFAPGGSTGEFARKKAQANARIAELNTDLSRLSNQLDQISVGFNAPKAGSEDAYNNLRRHYDALMTEKMRLVKDANLEPFEEYNRLAGEAEARAVEARRRMSPAERRAKPFWESYDLPESELTVRQR